MNIQRDHHIEPEFEEREVSKNRIADLLEKEEFDQLRSELTDMEPEDIADLMRDLSVEDKLAVFKMLDTESAAVVLDDTDSRTRLLILQRSDKKRLAKILDEMPADEAADVIDEIPEDEREDYLHLMDKEDAEDVEELLSYPDDSSGRIMTPSFVMVGEEDDVDDAILSIRRQEPGGNFCYVYVVDNSNNLKGIVPLDKLLTSPRGTQIKSIMEEDIHSVFVDTDQEQAAVMMKKYDLLAIPVTDNEGKLVGRITSDDILDIIDEEHGEDISMMTGTIEEEEGTESTAVAAKNRLPWLITCMLGSIITGLVIQFFEVTLAEMIALVCFIPVVTATGGNSGVQASTVVVRGLALGRMNMARLGEEIIRQLKIALSLGLICGTVLSVIAGLWKNNNVLGLIAGLSIFLVVVWSNFVGVSIPVIFKKLKIDPAIASGPLITTLNDIIGVFIYLTVASVFLK